MPGSCDLRQDEGADLGDRPHALRRLQRLRRSMPREMPVHGQPIPSFYDRKDKRTTQRPAETGKTRKERRGKEIGFSANICFL